MSSYSKTILERVEFQTESLPKGVPLLIDDWTLAFHLGFTGQTIWHAVKCRNDMYDSFEINKATGGKRLIHNPKMVMRYITKQIRSRILLPLCQELGPHVTAYQIGKSTVDAAKRHLAPCKHCDPLDGYHVCNTELIDYVGGYRFERTGSITCHACQTPPKHDCPRRGIKIHMDLKDFFGSTRRAWVRGYFHTVVGYNHYVSSLLANLCTVSMYRRDAVPQGSIVSGDICNLVADWLIDQPLLKALPDWTYSRYADDLYFSYPAPLSDEAIAQVIETIEAVIHKSGYRVNRKKLQIQKPYRRQRILGVTLNQKINIPREDYRKLRSLIHNCYQHGFASQADRAKKDGVDKLLSHISGKLSYFDMLAPERTKKLRLLYHAARMKHLSTWPNVMLEHFDFK